MGKKYSPGVAPGAASLSRRRLSRHEHIIKKAHRKAIRSAPETKRFFFDNISIYACPQDSWEYSIVVSKRSGAAHERNHIKRIIREGYRSIKAEIAQPYAILFYIQRPPKALGFSSLKGFLREHLDG